MRFAFRRSWWIGLDPDALWDALTDTGAYTRWWPWLRDAQLPELTVGQRAEFVVAPPLPYRLHLRLDLTDVMPGRRVGVRVDGDLGGRATLSLTPAQGGSVATLAWDLELRRRGLRSLGGLARPVLEAGHEWVVRSAVRSFGRVTGAEVREIDQGVGGPARRAPVPTIVGDGAMAAVVAGVVSGAPSTLAALVSRRPILASTRAAGTLLGAPTLTRGVIAHTAVSLGWATGLAALWPRRAGIAASAAAGAVVGIGIAAIDVGVIAPGRFPAVAALPTPAQLVDHAAFGAVVGATLAWRRSRIQGHSRFPSGERQSRAR